MKAIETVYKGYRFRSRLEARWAVFFDALGLRWEYEPEGFELPSERYLPDFRVEYPSLVTVYVEVKPPVALSAQDETRLWEFGQEVMKDEAANVGFLVVRGDPLGGMQSFLFGRFNGAAKAGPVDVMGLSWGTSDASVVAQAAVAARSARFEHGESGAPR